MSMNGHRPERWQRIDLADPVYAIPAEPPSIAGLLYRGRRHVLSGPPESTKTLIALAIGLEHLREGGQLCHIDFEMGAVATRRLLDDLGATAHEIAAIIHYEPAAPPLPADIQAIIDHGVTLAIIDAAAGAYDASGLDDNKRQDAEIFARAWIRPLFNAEIATVLIDHVVKNSEQRGRYAIGSERKLGTADVHLGLEAKVPLHRGTHGIVVMSTHKDRPGHLARPHPAEIELRSDPDTHAISWKIKPLATVENGERWKPTALMEKVSRYLEEEAAARSRNTIESGVTGNAKYLRAAIDELISAGFVTEETGPRGSRLVTTIKPYRDDSQDDLVHLVPTSSSPRPDEVASDFVPPRPSSSPLQGGRDEVDEVATGRRTKKTSSTSSMDDDPEETARLLALYATEPEHASDWFGG